MKKKVISEKIKESEFDMVFVDGPAAWEEGKSMIRLPALPFISKYLCDDFSIFLDDAYREGEKRISEIWENILDLRSERISSMRCFRPSDKKIKYTI